MREKWYKEGLRFGCVQCGRCCGGAPGNVWANAEQRKAAAECLGISIEELHRRYVRRVGWRYSFNEQTNYDCVFLLFDDDHKSRCRIYSARPSQCRTWPFWGANLASRRAWEQAARNCRGMNRGRLYDLAEIERLRGQWKSH